MILIFLIFLFQIICKVKSALDAKSEQRYLVNDQLLNNLSTLVVFFRPTIYVHTSHKLKGTDITNIE